jgi:MFS family permease
MWKRSIVLALLTLGVVISYIDRTNFSIVLVMKPFQHEFHITDQQRGLLNSAFFWSYTLLQIPAGWIVDRFGVRIPYAIGFFVWSGISAGTAFLGSAAQFVIARVMLGVGESIAGPASIKWIHDHFKERRRGLATGLYFSGTKVGLAVAAPVTVWLSQGWGWRGMFLILGAGALLWLIPWLLLVKDDSGRAEARILRGDSVSLRSVLKTPAMWGILLGSFAYQYFVYFCMTWMPAYYVERRHLSLNAMGLFQMFSFAGMAIIAVVAGWLADWFIARGSDPVRTRKIFVVLGFLVASTEVIGSQAGSDQVAIFFAVLSLAGLGLTTANYWVLTQALVPGPAIGRAIGAQNLAANAAGAVAPLLTGWLKATTGSYEAPLNVVWVFLILGAVSYIVLVRPSLSALAGARS